MTDATEKTNCYYNFIPSDWKSLRPAHGFGLLHLNADESFLPVVCSCADAWDNDSENTADTLTEGFSQEVNCTVQIDLFGL